MKRRRQVVVHLDHHRATADPTPANLVNLDAERRERRNLEMDLQCRDCGKVCCSLAELTGHYAGRCRRHPSGGDIA